MLSVRVNNGHYQVAYQASECLPLFCMRAIFPEGHVILNSQLYFPLQVSNILLAIGCSGQFKVIFCSSLPLLGKEGDGNLSVFSNCQCCSSICGSPTSGKMYVCRMHILSVPSITPKMCSSCGPKVSTGSGSGIEECGINFLLRFDISL